MGYDRGDSFPFDFEPNGIPFGSKSKEKLSPRSYPIQCERNWKYSFLSVKIFSQIFSLHLIISFPDIKKENIVFFFNLKTIRTKRRIYNNMVPSTLRAPSLGPSSHDDKNSIPNFKQITSMHTEKYFRNLVNSNRNQIVFTTFQINRKMVNTI